LRILWLVAPLTGHPRSWAAMDVTPQQTGTGSTTTYASPHNGDPAHDPEKDLAAAGAEAKNSYRYIFALVGDGAAGATSRMISSGSMRISRHYPGGRGARSDWKPASEVFAALRWRSEHVARPGCLFLAH
jgi:hypothetical protein